MYYHWRYHLKRVMKFVRNRKRTPPPRQSVPIYSAIKRPRSMPYRTVDVSFHVFHADTLLRFWDVVHSLYTPRIRRAVWKQKFRGCEKPRYRANSGRTGERRDRRDEGNGISTPAPLLVPRPRPLYRRSYTFLYASHIYVHTIHIHFFSLCTSTAKEA